jgi:DTW domain-containing protein YfiP
MATAILDDLAHYIDREGEWDTHWQAAEIVTLALTAYAREREAAALTDAYQIADGFNDRTGHEIAALIRARATALRGKTP